MRSALKAVWGHRCLSPRRTTGGPVIPLTPTHQAAEQTCPAGGEGWPFSRGFPDFSAIIPAPVRATRPVAVRIRVGVEGRQSVNPHRHADHGTGVQVQNPAMR